MKKKLELFIFLVLTLIISTSCIFTGPSIKGNGNVVKEIRKVDDFDEIKVSRGMNVYISQGSAQKIIVQADENLMDVIETRVEGNTLRVTCNQSIRHATSNKVFVTVEDISVIKSTAGSNVYSESVIESKNLDLSCSSGSNMKLEVEVGNLDVATSAGSNIKLEGVTSNFYGKATSGSNIKAEELKCKNSEAIVSSGANIWITAKENLQAHSTSGGNIFYYGNPETIDIEKSSGGNVIKR